MTMPQRFLTRMLLFLVIVAAAVSLLFPPLRSAFMANAVLNGVILGVLFFGIFYIFRTVTMLRGEVAWIEEFRRDQAAVSVQAPPRLLAPMATMLGERERTDRLSLSTVAMRTLLDGVGARLDESREISRYMIGLLVFLGLLGTFWGLLETVRSVGDVIGGLSVTAGEIASVFQDLKQGLEAPLSGMGTAFSSSLFGLGGSLVLGFLELQAGQAQNRFFNDLEEWLSGLTRLSSGSLSGDGETSVPAYIQALLEQTADSLDSLQRIIQRSEEGRNAANTNILQLTDKLSALTDQMRAEQSLMLKLAASQMELRPIFAKLAERDGGDEVMRNHIRSIEVHIGRILEELPQGREELVGEIRSEIRLLARTIAALAEDGEPKSP